MSLRRHYEVHCKRHRPEWKRSDEDQNVQHLYDSVSNRWILARTRRRCTMSRVKESSWRHSWLTYLIRSLEVTAIPIPVWLTWQVLARHTGRHSKLTFEQHRMMQHYADHQLMGIVEGRACRRWYPVSAKNKSNVRRDVRKNLWPPWYLWRTVSISNWYRSVPAVLFLVVECFYVGQPRRIRS